MLSTYEMKDRTLEVCETIEPNAWVRLIDPTQEELDEVSKKCDIALDDLQDILDPDQVSSFEDYDDGFMLVINIPLNDPDFTYAYTTIPLSIVLCRNTVITICKTKMDSFQEYIDRRGKRFDPARQYMFVCELLLLSADLYQKYLHALNHERHDKVRTMESHKSTPNSELMQLHEMETTFVYFESALSGNKVAIDLLKSHMNRKSISENADLLEDVIDATDQSIEMASVFRELLESTRDLYSSVVDNNLNAIMKILTGLTIVLAVPAIVTGFFGMNVEANSFPLGGTAYGFSIVLVITVVICLILAWWLHRKDFM